MSFLSYDCSLDRVREIALFAWLASKTFDCPDRVANTLQFSSELSDQRIQSAKLLYAPKIFSENYQNYPYGGFAAATRNEVIIALRGTRCSPSHLDEVILDIIAFPDDSGIHLGFNLYAGFIWNQLVNFLSENNNSDKRIVIVGHSLGSSAATLITYMLNQYGYTNSDYLKTYIFGAPALGIVPITIATPLYTFNNSIDPIPFVLQKIAPEIIQEFLVPSIGWIQSNLLPFLPLDFFSNLLLEASFTLSQYRHANSTILHQHAVGAHGICKYEDLDDQAFEELQSHDYIDSLVRDTLLHQDLGLLFNEISQGQFNRLLGVIISAIYGRLIHKHQMRVYATSLGLMVDDN